MLIDEKNLEIKESPKLGALKSVHESWLNDKNEIMKTSAMLFIFGAPIGLLLTPFIGIWVALGIVVGLLVLVCVMPFFNFRVVGLSSISLHQNGIALRDRDGVKEIAWNEIESVSTRPSSGGSYNPLGQANACIVRTTTGEIIRINSAFARADVLVKSAMRESAAILLPKFLKKIETGERIKFGTLEVDRNALHFGSRLPMRWQEIRNLKSDGLSIIIYFKDQSRPITVNIAVVPNHYVLCEMANALVRSAV